MVTGPNESGLASTASAFQPWKTQARSAQHACLPIPQCSTASDAERSTAPISGSSAVYEARQAHRQPTRRGERELDGETGEGVQQEPACPQVKTWSLAAVPAAISPLRPPQPDRRSPQAQPSRWPVPRGPSSGCRCAALLAWSGCSTAASRVPRPIPHTSPRRLTCPSCTTTSMAPGSLTNRPSSDRMRSRSCSLL